jgi:hypothetical protein
MSTDPATSLSPQNRAKLEAIRPERRATLIDLFRGDAALDAERVTANFADDVVFQIGGGPPLVGRAAVTGMLRGLFSSGAFASLEHDLLEVYDLDDALIWRADAHYLRPDGSRVVTPYVNRVRFAGRTCTDYRVHIDLSALSPR